MCLYNMDTLVSKFYLKQNILHPSFDIAEQPQAFKASAHSFKRLLHGC